ncbi:hypothetical protein F7725_002996, partial [Dissostichus mawsoni]
SNSIHNKAEGSGSHYIKAPIFRFSAAAPEKATHSAGLAVGQQLCGDGPQKPLNLGAFTLCMRVATELPNMEREIILFAYRTQDFDELNVWQELDGRWFMFKAPKLGPTETHMCVTWDSTSGAAAIFMDGRKSVTKMYMKGHRIRSEGKVIIGQDPDNYLGSFDAKQSFVGSISDVNMWDSVLSDSTIQDMNSGKRVPRGNVFDWESVELEVKGGAEIVNTSDRALLIAAAEPPCLLQHAAVWALWSIGAGIYDYFHTSAMEERIHTLENVLSIHQFLIAGLSAGLLLLITYIFWRKH